ncbi:hypothetical protein ACWGIV_24785 [Streptomyces sp. NPDC054844]
MTAPPGSEKAAGDRHTRRTGPSIPSDARVSHSRKTSASVVDGHSAHGADSRRAVMTASGAALCLRHGHEVVSAPASRHKSKRDEVSRHSSAAPPDKPHLQPLERGAACGVPDDQLTVYVSYHNCLIEGPSPTGRSLA